MSSRNESYSKEFRSFYSRSSSSQRKNASDSFQRRWNGENRPLSRRLIERDLSSSSSSFDRRSREIFDDFERRRRRFFSSSFDDLFDEQFFTGDFGRSIPIQQRNQINSTTRTIPVQYRPSTDNRRSNVEKSNYSFDSVRYDDVNRFGSSNDRQKNRESPTRKRTTLNIQVRQPHVQYSEATSHHSRTTSTPNYSSGNKAVYL